MSRITWWVPTAVLAALGAALFGCPNLSELMGGGDASATDSAASDTGLAEAGLADGEGLADAGWCSTHPHTFCDDFDETPLGALWDKTSMAHGSLTLDPAAYVSPPLSLSAVAYDAGPNSAGGPQLVKTLGNGTLAQKVHCEADVRLDQVTTTTGGALTIFYMSLAGTGPDVQDAWVRLNVNAKASFFEFHTQFADGGGAPSTLPLDALTIAEWGHFTVEVQFPSGAGGSVSVSVNGATASASVVTPPGSPSQTLTLSGMVAMPPTTQWQVHFDNVWCDVTR
jgi:hypothetical protein